MTIHERSLRQIGLSMEELFEFWATKTVEGPKYMKNAKLIDEIKGWRLPSCPKVNKCYAAGALAIGDAISGPEAAFIYGVTPAMFGGQVVGEVLPELLEKGDFTEEAFSVFQSKLEETLNPSYEASNVFKEKLLSHPEHVKGMNEYAKTLSGYPDLIFQEVVGMYFVEKLGIDLSAMTGGENKISQ